MHLWPKATEVYWPALVRVVHDAGQLPIAHGHLEARRARVASRARTHGPADHTSTPDVKDDGEVEEAVECRYVRDVRNPELMDGFAQTSVRRGRVRRPQFRSCWVVTAHLRGLTPPEALSTH